MARLRNLALCVCCSACLGWTCAQAAEGAAAPAQEWFEAARASARASAEWLARSVDSWFGDQAFEQGGSVTDGRLSLRLFHRPDQKTDVDLRFDARFRLPNLEKYAYVFVGRDKASEAIQDTAATRANPAVSQSARIEERSFLAGLGFALPNDVDFRLGLGGRLNPYVQARYSRAWGLTPSQSLYFRETLFWTRTDRLGATTALSYELNASPTLTLRWLNVGTVTQAAKQLEWSSTLGVYRSFGNQRLLALELLRNGTVVEGSAKGEFDRGVLLKWEQPLHHDWLLGEVVAGAFWPRPQADGERRRVWALGAGLKMHF
jgi:hypothetical protein